MSNDNDGDYEQLVIVERSRRLFFLLVLLICVVGLFVLVTEALAHRAPTGWYYPSGCCSGRDCAMIPLDQQVETKPDGYHVVLVPGDHDFAPNGLRITIPYDFEGLRFSPDGKYHICLNPSLKLICFYRGDLSG